MNKLARSRPRTDRGQRTAVRGNRSSPNGSPASTFVIVIYECITSAGRLAVWNDV